MKSIVLVSCCNFCVRLECDFYETWCDLYVTSMRLVCDLYATSMRLVWDLCETFVTVVVTVVVVTVDVVTCEN